MKMFIYIKNNERDNRYAQVVCIRKDQQANLADWLLHTCQELIRLLEVQNASIEADKWIW